MGNEIFKLFATIESNGKTVVKDLKAVDSQGSKTAKKLTKAFNGLTKVMKVAIVAGAAAATVAVVKMAKDGLEAFMEFEEGMNEVFTLLPGITEEAMDSMKEDVKSLAKEMGILPNEIVPALYQAISAGIPQENVFDFMEIASMAAIGGVTSLETAVDGLTSVVNAYGSETITATEASDIMFTAVRLGKTTLDELADRLFQVNPIAAALGVSFGDVAAAMAEITAQGTPTRVAATQLRSLFAELSTAGGEVAEIFTEIAGMSFKDFIAEGHDLGDALDLLADYANTNSIEMKDMFGNVEAGMAVLALTGKHADSYSEKIDEMTDSAGATALAHERMATGLKKQWDKIKAWWATVKINIGERLQEPVQKFITFLKENEGKIEKFVTDIFDKLLDAFQWVMDNSDKIGAAIKVVSVAFGVLVAIKAALWIKGVVLALSGPAGLIAALGLAGIALGLFLKKHGPEMEEAWGNVRDRVKEATKGIVDMGVSSDEAYRRAARGAKAFDDAIAHIDSTIPTLLIAEQDLADTTKYLGETQEKTASGIISTIFSVVDAARTAGATLRDAIKTTADTTKEEVDTMVTRVLERMNTFKEGFEEVYNKVVPATKSTWKQLVSLVETGWSDMVKEAKSGIKTFYDAMSDMGDKLKSLLSNTVGDMFNAFATYWSDKEEAAEEHAERLLEIEEEHAENVAELDEQYQEDLVRSDEDYARDREDIKEDYLQKIEDMEEGSNDRREQAEKRFNERIEDLGRSHEERAMDRESRYQDDLEEEDLRYHRRREDIEKDYQRDLSKLKADDFEGRQRVEERHAERIEDLDIEHGRRRTDIETGYEADVEKEIERFQRDQADTQRDHIRDIEELEERSADDREDALDTYNDRIVGIDEDHADNRERIEGDYTEAIERLQDVRQTARDDEVTAYGNQERSLGDILWDIVKMAAEALKQQLLVSAAYHLVEAVAWSLIPPLFAFNPSAIGHYAAAAVLGAAGLGLAAAQALFGFAEGGMVSGSTLGMVGEGAYSEAVLPLSPAVFADIGAGIVGAMSEVGGGVGGDLRPASADRVEININIEEAYIRDEEEAEDLSNLLAERLAVEVRSIGLVAA